MELWKELVNMESDESKFPTKIAGEKLFPSHKIGQSARTEALSISQLFWAPVIT